MRYYTCNLNADIDRYLRDQDNLLLHLPKCSECEEPIQDDCLYEFDGKLICPYCIELNHRRYTDEFIG